VTPRAALTGALLLTMATPATWPLGLAVFLLRGGLLVVALPIVVLPTPVGIGNLVAPTLTRVVLGGVSVGFALLVTTIVVAGLAWVVAGGLLAATFEAEAARIVAAKAAAPVGVIALDQHETQDLAGSAASWVVQRHRIEASRIFRARAVAHLPLVIAIAWGSARLVAVTYRELTNPFDVATPVVWRVLRGSPDVVAAIVLTWMLGQVVGAIAARKVALTRGGTAAALRAAFATLLRRPLTVLLDFWLPTLVLALVLAPSAVAAASAGEVVRAAMNSRNDPVGLVLAVVLFVSLWMVGVALTGVICAWRAAVWTVGFGEPSR